MVSRHIVKINLSSTNIKHITFQGASHMVVPTVMLISGVHNGSAGPLLYDVDEIRASVPHWNGRPVTLGHPTTGNDPVSVYSSPEVFERSFGTVWNAHMEDNKLKAMLYLHLARTQQLAPQLLQTLKAGREVEVSTGFFSRDQKARGRWNNEEYEAVVRDIQPDHLAVLLDQKGACSWEDGCGIRANASGNAKKPNGFKRGGAAMQEQEPLVLPVLNPVRLDHRCPCPSGELPILDKPEALDLPQIYGRRER